MNVYAQLPDALQDCLATSAGIVLSDFDPNGSHEAETIKSSILFATSGGVNTSCVFTYKDNGEDVDNCPKNTKELLEVESVECTMSGTAVTLTDSSALSLLGAADKSGSDVIELAPRMDLKSEDFKALWYVCPYGKKGGFAAVKLDNALSTGGFAMQSEDNAKGKFAFSYKGYSSLTAPEAVPFRFYLRKAASLPAMEVLPEV